MSKLKFSICVIAGALTLASCQTNQSSTQQGVVRPALTPAPETNPTTADASAINGKWIPTTAAAQAVYYNEFKNGKFVSRSPDGTKTIAAGSYKTATNGDIQMNWYSEARKANASAVCKKLTTAELQCSSGVRSLISSALKPSSNLTQNKKYTIDCTV